MFWGRFGEALDSLWVTLGTHWRRIEDALGTHWGRIRDFWERIWDAILEVCGACSLEGFSVLLVKFFRLENRRWHMI